MSASRRDIRRALQRLGDADTTAPSPSFVADLERRLMAAPTARPAGTARRFRAVRRGAILGISAALVGSAGAAAVAIVAVRHDDGPPPAIAPTTLPGSVAASPAPAPSPPATVSSPAPVSAPSSEPSTDATPAPIPTSAPVAEPPAVPPLPEPTAAPSTDAPPPVPPSTTAPTPSPAVPASAAPTTTSPAPVTIPAATAVPTAEPIPTPPPTASTEVRVPATLTLDCSAGAGGVTCSWSAAPVAFDHYVVLRSTPGESMGRVFSPSADELSYVDTTAAPGVAYTYLVHALDAGGRSVAHSQPITVACCG